jgi:lipopolysaccharide biosynthesis regulator YciM
MAKLNIFLVLISLSIITPIFSDDNASDNVAVETQEEALLLRRIIEFWEEGEIDIVKDEVTKYLSDNMDTPFSNYLLSLLGDIYMREEKYSKAVVYYGTITHTEENFQVLVKYLQCLYELQQFDVIAEKAGPIFTSCMDKNNLDFANPDFLQSYFLLSEAYYRMSLEEKEDLKYTKLAEEYYKALLTTEFKEMALQALANLYHKLEDYETAVDVYMTLADEHKDDEEIYLFHAAVLQSNYDKKEALITFGRVLKLDQSKAQEAAYNMILLCYETQKYAQLVEHEEELLRILPDDKMSYLSFFVGKSYFYLEDYRSAAQQLNKYLCKEEGKTPETKSALVTIIQCANILEDIDMLAQAVNQFEVYFKDDEYLPQVYLAKGILEKKVGYPQKANETFDYIEKTYTSLSESKVFLIERALLYDQMEMKEQSLPIFRHLINTFPEYADDAICWGYLINASIACAEEQKEEKSQQQLMDDLKVFLSKENIASDEEIEEYTFLIVQCEFNTGNYKEVVENLSRWIENNASSPHLACAYYMLAFSYKNLDYIDEFCDYAEEALTYDEGNFNKKALHLALFNTYTDDISNKEGDVNEHLLDKASDHIYAAQEMNWDGIKQENILWLIDNYYLSVNTYLKGKWKDKVVEKKSELDIKANRAITLLEKLLLTETKELVINQSNIALEEEIIKLSELYGATNNIAAQKNILEIMVDHNTKDTGVVLKHSDKAVFQLAQMLEASGDNISAKKCYDKLLKSPKTTFYNALATLKSVRMKFLDKKDGELSFSDSEVISDLKQLKSLSINKKMDNEPIHLEAALDYIDLQCLLMKKEEKYSKRLKLLTKMKDNFTKQKDIISKDYHARRGQLPEKDRLYQAYLTLIEAEIFMCKSSLGVDGNTISNRKLALQTLNAMRVDDLIVNEYINNRMAKDYQLLKGEIDI